MIQTAEEIFEEFLKLPRTEQLKVIEFLRAEKNQVYQEALVIREKNRLAELAQIEARYRPRTEWIKENTKDYLGQWLAFQENELFAHGTSREEVHKGAYSKGAKMVFLYFVGEKKFKDSDSSDKMPKVLN